MWLTVIDTVECAGLGQNSNVSYYLIVEEINDKTSAIPFCEDGTEFGTCSDNGPSYCYNGRLIDKCGIFVEELSVYNTKIKLKWIIKT